MCMSPCVSSTAASLIASYTAGVGPAPADVDLPARPGSASRLRPDSWQAVARLTTIASAPSAAARDETPDLIASTRLAWECPTCNGKDSPCHHWILDVLTV